MLCLLLTENNEDANCSHIYMTRFNWVVGTAYSLNPHWVKLSSPLPILSLVFLYTLSFLFVLSYLLRQHAPLPFEGSAVVCPYGRAVEVHGGFLVLIGANNSGHLPGLSLLARVWSGLTDHSAEGHFCTCAPGRVPETIAFSCSHHTDFHIAV